MAYIITKKNGTRPLNDFEFNGLPVKKNSTGEMKFTDKQFHFYSDCFTVFNTKDEAENYIDFVKAEILKNETRYESAMTGSTAKLMKIANRLKVKETE